MSTDGSKIDYKDIPELEELKKVLDRHPNAVKLLKFSGVVLLFAVLLWLFNLIDGI